LGRYTVKITILILIFIVGLGFGASYINKKTMEPFKVVDSFVNDAMQGKYESIHLIDRDSWDQLNETSIYRGVTKELQWNDFVEFINREEVESIIISPKYSFKDKVKNFKQKEVQLDIHTYDRYGKENGQISLVIATVNNEWKIVGAKK